MNISNLKIKAFTLNEMIVVLLITTLVVGMAFAVLQLVQNQMHDIQNNYERNTELNRLRQALWIDFNSYEEIYYDEQNSVLELRNEIASRSYSFQKSQIIREHDTFSIELQNQRFYFKNIEQLGGKVDAIHLTTTSKLGGQQLFVYKKNSAHTYMNQ